MCILRDET